jgi:hypothetical protein
MRNQHSIKKIKMQAETATPVINSHYGAMKDFNRNSGSARGGLSNNFLTSEKRVLTGEMVFVKVLPLPLGSLYIGRITDLARGCCGRGTDSLPGILLNKGSRERAIYPVTANG